MTCEDLLQALNAYVDGALAPEACASFESHLAGCDPCTVVVDNVRRTIRLCKDGEPYPLPAEFQAGLRAALRARWRERAGA